MPINTGGLVRGDGTKASRFIADTASPPGKLAGARALS